MDTIKLEKVSEVFFKITCNMSQSMELKEHFSFYIPNRFFNPKVKQKLWDGKLSSFNRSNDTLPIGLFNEFKKFCLKFGYNYEFVEDVNDKNNDMDEDFFDEFYKRIFRDTVFYPRDYQHEEIATAIKYKRGLLEAATGSGKSLCIYSIIRFILGVEKGNVLLIVPNIGLVNQMVSDFKEYGFKGCDDLVSILYSGQKPDLRKPILVSTWQSLQRKGGEFFERFDAVIIDECHLAKALQLKNILSKCINSYYRIGLTGTLPTEQSDMQTIIGYIGPKLMEVKSKELMDNGVLSEIKIANLWLQYPKKIIELNKNRSYPEEVRFITEYPDRNKVLKYIIDRLDDDDNVLILCHIIEHLKAIKEYLEINCKGYEIHEIYGKVDATKREEIRISTNNKKGVIIVGTYNTMSTGFNLPRLHHVIFASSYKSKIKVLQSIGRGLRKHISKSKLILWDLVDDLRWTKRTGTIGKNYIFQHFEKRLEYYKSQGFSFINKRVDIGKL